jgi:hypothetical protein
MSELAAIAFLSVFVEGAMEYFGRRIPSNYKPYVAAAVGILVALAFEADLFALLGLEAVWPFAGNVATGLAIGRGSNYLYEFVGRRAKPAIRKVGRESP